MTRKVTPRDIKEEEKVNENPNQKQMMMRRKKKKASYRSPWTGGENTGGENIPSYMAPIGGTSRRKRIQAQRAPTDEVVIEEDIKSSSSSSPRAAQRVNSSLYK